MGNEAFAHAALAAGVRVVAGYPGTPSSELIEKVAALRAAGKAPQVHVEWSTNEKVALELLFASSLAGARCLFTCKQVGLNVASDALLSLNYLGVKGGLVLFVADDPGPISSQTEQDTRRFAKFAKVPVLDPANIEQGYEMMQLAFELSEQYETPVILRSSTRICHASSFLDLEEENIVDRSAAKGGRPVPEGALVLGDGFENVGDGCEAKLQNRSRGCLPGFERDQRWVIFPKRAYEAHAEINERLPKIAADFAQESFLCFNPIREAAPAASAEPTTSAANTSPRLGLLAGGVSVSYVLEALSMLELACQKSGLSLPPYRFMQLGTPYPFPEEAFAPFAEGLEKMLVIEELDHVLEDEAQAFCGRHHAGFDVLGKLTGDARDRGENTVDDVFARIAAFFGLDIASPFTAGVRTPTAPTTPATTTAFAAPAGIGPSQAAMQAPELPARPPVMCAGCPHRGSFYAVKLALKKLGSTGIFCGDIGCYTLGNAKPLEAVDTCLCMGGGITMAQGFSVVDKSAKQLAFIGDSTFFASGLPGIVNAVYNDHDITVVVLDNMLTAMTGAQPHPGTGHTLMGTKSEPISIEALLRAAGFTAVFKANPFLLEESVTAAAKAIGHRGPSAVVFEAPCIMLVKPQAPVEIGSDCSGCKRCIKEIGCPAIGFDEASASATINAGLCTGCELCIALCPFEVIAKTRGGATADD